MQGESLSSRPSLLQYWVSRRDLDSLAEKHDDALGHQRYGSLAACAKATYTDIMRTPHEVRGNEQCETMLTKDPSGNNARVVPLHQSAFKTDFQRLTLRQYHNLTSLLVACNIFFHTGFTSDFRLLLIGSHCRMDVKMSPCTDIEGQAFPPSTAALYVHQGSPPVVLRKVYPKSRDGH
jgi:hypothetical protein